MVSGQAQHTFIPYPPGVYLAIAGRYVHAHGHGVSSGVYPERNAYDDASRYTRSFRGVASYGENIEVNGNGFDPRLNTVTLLSVPMHVMCVRKRECMRYYVYRLFSEVFLYYDGL